MIRLALFVPLALFIGLSALLLLGLDKDPTELPSALVGEKFPSFTLIALDEEQGMLSEKDLIGEVALVNVWATWCAPCRDEMPTLERLRGHLAHEDFVVFAVSQDVDGLAAVKPYISEYGYTFPVLIDVGGEIGRRYGVTGYPESFVIDRTGQVVYHHVGYNDWAQMNVVTAIRGLITRGQWRLG